MKRKRTLSLQLGDNLTITCLVRNIITTGAVSVLFDTLCVLMQLWNKHVLSFQSHDGSPSLTVLDVLGKHCVAWQVCQNRFKKTVHHGVCMHKQHLRYMWLLSCIASEKKVKKIQLSYWNNPVKRLLVATSRHDVKGETCEWRDL